MARPASLNTARGAAGAFYARKRNRLRRMLDKLRKPVVLAGGTLRVVLRVV